jgi:hypothetical protein
MGVRASASVSGIRVLGSAIFICSLMEIDG